MELRVLVGGVRRAAWLVVLLGVIGLLAGLQFSGRSLDEAEVTLLLDPEAVSATGTDAADRYIEDQIGILLSEPVAATAAELVEGVDAQEISDSLSARQRPGSNIVDLVSSASSVDVASEIVDAVAEVYLQRPRPQEERRAERMGQLETELSQIEARLVELQSAISAVDDPPGELIAERDVLQRRYDELLPRLINLRFMEIPEDRTALVEPASAVTGSGERSTAISALLGLLLGSGAGVAVAAAWFAASPRIVDARYAEYLLGVPTAARIRLRRRRGRAVALTERALRPIRQLTALINGTPASTPRRVAVCQLADQLVTSPIARALAHAFASQGLETAYVSLAERAETEAPSPSHLRSGWRPIPLRPKLVEWVRRAGNPVSSVRIGALLDEIGADIDVIIFDLGPIFEREAALALARAADDRVVIAPLDAQVTDEARLVRESLVEPEPARTHMVIANRTWWGSTASPDRAGYR